MPGVVGFPGFSCGGIDGGVAGGVVSVGGFESGPEYPQVAELLSINCSYDPPKPSA